jgi:uncharacterized protein
MNTSVKRLVLDVLKPHAPNSLEFARALADPGCRVRITVQEMDEQTETVVVTVEGENIDFERLRETIETMGGSLHSIDEVDVQGEVPSAD